MNAFMREVKRAAVNKSRKKVKGRIIERANVVIKGVHGVTCRLPRLRAVSTFFLCAIFPAPPFARKVNPSSNRKMDSS